jgi:hypothetical protein
MKNQFDNAIAFRMVTIAIANTIRVLRILPPLLWENLRVLI